MKNCIVAFAVLGLFMVGSSVSAISPEKAELFTQLVAKAETFHARNNSDAAYKAYRQAITLTFKDSSREGIQTSSNLLIDLILSAGKRGYVWTVKDALGHVKYYPEKLFQVGKVLDDTQQDESAVECFARAIRILADIPDPSLALEMADELSKRGYDSQAADAINRVQ